MKTSSGKLLLSVSLLSMLLAVAAMTAGGTTFVTRNHPDVPGAAACSKIDDATLTQNVHDELAKTLSANVMAHIQITVKRRVVTLTGSVTYKPSSLLAAKLARKVSCVKKVINQLKHRGSAQECVGGQTNCCCPETGCECYDGRVCPVCGSLKH